LEQASRDLCLDCELGHQSPFVFHHSVLAHLGDCDYKSGHATTSNPMWGVQEQCSTGAFDVKTDPILARLQSQERNLYCNECTYGAELESPV
jgi:hypothetical protein